MAADLAAGSRVVFALEKLDVVLTRDGGEESRLPVWERVTCERVGERTITGRMAMLRTADAVRGD